MLTMESYLLLLYVTLEQEDAIKVLYNQRGWPFKKNDLSILQEDAFKHKVEVEGVHRQTTDNQQFREVGNILTTGNQQFREEGNILTTDNQPFEDNHNLTADDTKFEESSAESSDYDSDITILSTHNGVASQENNERLPFENEHAAINTSVSYTKHLDNSDIRRDSSVLERGEDLHNIEHLDNNNSRRDSSAEHSEGGEDLHNIVLDQETEALAKTLISLENVDSWFNNALGFNKDDSRERDMCNQPDSDKDVENDTPTVTHLNTKQEKNKNNFVSSKASIKLKIEKGKLAFRQKRRKRESEKKMLNEERTSDINNANRATFDAKRKGKKRKIHCGDCKTTFTSQRRYDSHKEKNDGKCVFECEYCGKMFLYRKSKYLLHIRSAHTKERPFVCETCGKGYVTSDKLKIHKRVHTGEKPCICEECGRSFYSRAELSIHKDYHHASKECLEDFRCEECEITFCSKRYLIYHKTVTHSNQRDFLCNKCDKRFKCNSALQRHLKHIHTESRNYKCEMCEKSFKTKACLKKHTVRHGGEKLFFCNDCNKGFYEKAKLLQHVRIHTGEKPYQCDLCDYRCALSGNLSKHRKTHKMHNLS